MPFSMKPLELTDFSGGLTDNYLAAGPTHYAQGDNFWITVDKNLSERFGTRILDPVAYNLPLNGNRRVSGLYTYINESILLAQAGRNIYNYVQNAGFKSILGPTGNEPLSAGDQYSSVVSAEWNRHMYFVSDAQGLPTKIYRDQNNTFQARSVGLPRTVGNPNLSNDQVLNKAIALANDLRNSMVNHIQDLSLHATLDQVALNYFVAQTFSPPPAEQPPAGVVSLGPCNNLATLEALIGNINAAFEHQRADASLNGARVYHINVYSYVSFSTLPISPTGIHAKLNQQSAPTTLALCAAAVDDLAQKWYWHRLAIWTHVPNNDYTAMNIYAVATPKIGLINTGQPVVTGNLQDPFNFVNNVKYMWNTHVNSTASPPGIAGQHKFADGTFSVTQPFRVNLPDAFDYDSYANLIFHMRVNYSLHYNEGVNTNSRLILFDTSAGSANLININYVNPFQLNAFPGGFITENLGAIINPVTFQNSAIFSAVSSGAATLLAPAVSPSNFTQTLGQMSQSQYHVMKNSIGAFIDVYPSNTTGTGLTTFAGAAGSTLSSQIDSVGTDARTWLALASEFFFVLAAHSADATMHIIASPVVSNTVTGVTSIYTFPNQPFFIPTIASYVYAFLFSDTYQVETNGLQYLVQSNPVFVGPVQTSTIVPPGATILSQSPTVYPNVTYLTPVTTNISLIPGVTNTVNTNYETASVVPANPLVQNNLTTDIYRSTDGGITYYKVISLVNGTTTYADQTADSVSYSGFPALNTNQTIYTTGGVVGNDQPPPSNCITSLNGYMYYGGIVDTGQSFPNRIRQSLANNPDSAPATFFDDLEDALVGLSSSRSVVLALCQRSIYRLNGNFNTLGQGLITHEKLSDAMGCISAKSIVKTEIGVFFAGTDGFYYTDGYQLIKISIEINQRYQQITQTATQQKRIVGSYDRTTRRIWWTAQTNPTDTNPDVFYVFYLDYGVKPSGVYTSASNFNWMRPASVTFFGGHMVYGHEEGYLLTDDPNVKTDPKIDVTKVPSLWQDVYIPYTFASSALDFGSLFTRKWTTKVHYTGNNVGNANMQITSVRDNRQDIAANLPVISYLNNPMWGQPNIIWNKPSAQQPYNWEYDGKIDSWRRFPAGNLRCDTKQIIITPSFSAVYRSQDWPPFCFASVNSTTKVISIATPTGFTNIIWPLDIVDMQFSFSNDMYVKTYTVTAVSGNTATVLDPANTLTTVGNLGWVIRGYKKGQRININSVIIYYDYLGDKNDAYLGKGSAGENV